MAAFFFRHSQQASARFFFVAPFFVFWFISFNFMIRSSWQWHSYYHFSKLLILCVLSLSYADRSRSRSHTPHSEYGTDVCECSINCCLCDKLFVVSNVLSLGLCARQVFWQICCCCLYCALDRCHVAFPPNRMNHYWWSIARTISASHQIFSIFSFVYRCTQQMQMSRVLISIIIKYFLFIEIEQMPTPLCSFQMKTHNYRVIPMHNLYILINFSLFQVKWNDLILCELVKWMRHLKRGENCDFHSTKMHFIRMNVLSCDTRACIFTLMTSFGMVAIFSITFKRWVLELTCFKWTVWIPSNEKKCKLHENCAQNYSRFKSKKPHTRTLSIPLHIQIMRNGLTDSLNEMIKCHWDYYFHLLRSNF